MTPHASPSQDPPKLLCLPYTRACLGAVVSLTITGSVLIAFCSQRVSVCPPLLCGLGVGEFRGCCGAYVCYHGRKALLRKKFHQSVGDKFFCKSTSLFKSNLICNLWYEMIFFTASVIFAQNQTSSIRNSVLRLSSESSLVDSG